MFLASSSGPRSLQTALSGPGAMLRSETQVTCEAVTSPSTLVPGAFSYHKWKSTCCHFNFMYKQEGSWPRVPLGHTGLTVTSALCNCTDAVPTRTGCNMGVISRYFISGFDWRRNGDLTKQLQISSRACSCMGPPCTLLGSTVIFRLAIAIGKSMPGRHAERRVPPNTVR
jgi:hypothetical protein